MTDIQKCLHDLGLKTPPCPIYFEAKNLRFWEMGGFFQTASTSWIELNHNRFFSYFGYESETILKHELIHAIRQDFPDSFWEELIAYQVSPHLYQRWLGPVMAQKKIFVILILLNLAIIFENIWVLLAAFSLLGFFLIRNGLQYHKLMIVKRHLQRQNMSNRDAFIALTKLSPQSLNELAKKAATSVRNF